VQRSTVVRVEPRLSNLIRNLYQADFLELDAAAEAMHELQGSRGWAVLSEILDAASADALRTMEQGGTLEHVAYVRGHAYRNGLQVARDAATTLISIAETGKQRAELLVGLAGGSTDGR
jgi:hypothetical protein